MHKILIINGPNTNLFGVRETSIYGNETMNDINNQAIAYGKKQGFTIDCYHSNIEGEIITQIHEARGYYDGIIINAGAYSHYSYAIRDAIAGVKIPCVEVHYSNVNTREEFRQKSVIAAVCAGSIVGFGKYVYILGIDALSYTLRRM